MRVVDCNRLEVVLRNLPVQGAETSLLEVIGILDDGLTDVADGLDAVLRAWKAFPYPGGDAVEAALEVVKAGASRIHPQLGVLQARWWAACLVETARREVEEMITDG